MKHRAIVSFHFTRTNVHEVTQLEKLLEPLYDLGDVYADSGYLSVNNCCVIVNMVSGDSLLMLRCEHFSLNKNDSFVFYI